MNIGIRADGGFYIGMGHVMRMLALARELCKKNNVFFICRVDDPLSNKYFSGINLIKENGFLVKEIDENKLKEDMKKIDADCIITDSYDVDEEYFNILKENFKISGCLDDENICEYFNVDFLINQNLYGKELKYKVNKDTKLLLGSDYVILRDEFKNNIKKKEISEEIKHIMLTVGGSDNKNITESIIKQFLGEKYILHVVIGSGFNNIENLKKYESEHIKLHFNANMKELMDMEDVCIASCGTTIYELASCGTPIIGIVVAENQEMLADFIETNHFAKVSEISKVIDVVKSLTYEERKNFNEKLIQLVDGQGIYRIVKEIEKYLI